MVFESFGAPIYESFNNHEPTKSLEERQRRKAQFLIDEGKYDFDCSDKHEVDGKVYCLRRDDVEPFKNKEEEEEKEKEEKEEKEDEEETTQTTGVGEEDGEDNSVPTTIVNEEEEEKEEEEEEEDDPYYDEEEEEEEEEEEAEGFSGSMNVEHFSGREMKDRALSLSVVLRSVLFGCLFYILAHPDTKNALLKSMKFLKNVDYLVVSMILFIVLHYVLSIFV